MVDKAPSSLGRVGGYRGWASSQPRSLRRKNDWGFLGREVGNVGIRASSPGDFLPSCS